MSMDISSIYIYISFYSTFFKESFMSDTNSLDLLMNVLYMSSNEIATLTGKEHKHVLRDIDRMFIDLYPDENERNLLETKFGTEFEILTGQGGVRKSRSFNLDKRHTICLIAGYSSIARMRIIDRWQELEMQNSTQFPQDYLSALEAFVAVQREKERLAKDFIKASNEVNEKTILLEHSEAVKARLEHTIEHHIQVPKAIPLESSDMGVYTNQEIEDLYKGHISLDKVKRCLEYVGHPTIEYQKEITTGRGLNKHTVSRMIKAYSKEVDIAISLQKAFYPDDEKASEYLRTTVRFTGKSMEIHGHPASQNYLIRLPKETATELFALTDDFFVPSKDFYDYLQFIQKGELTVVIF